MNRRVLLVILDGWGIAPASPGNAISLAKKPNFDLLWSKHPHMLLAASGEEVGLPIGQIGNSEVGHLNIGAGRVVWQDLPRISKAIKDGSFFENKVLLNTFKYVKENKKNLHIMGLVSDGGVHSHQEHLYALLAMARQEKVHNVYIHVFTDGRDVSPKSAQVYFEELESTIKKIGVGKIATITGRYYSMDRDNRWNRTNLAYNAMVLGRGELAKSAKEAIENGYKRDITDEFIRPTIIDKNGLINDEDGIIFFNLRSDRPREITKSLIINDFNGFKREKTLNNLYFVTMTEYEKDLPVKGVVFPQETVKNTLAEVISNENLKQFHIAETEKYAHVTFFINGGREEKFCKEDRLLINSPKVATYDLKPEMSAEKISTELAERLGRYDFIVVNFANLDMVGHTGKLESTIKAVETVDSCLGGLVTAARSMGYEVIITADHGNAEKMIEKGLPCTAHTTNPVPFVFVGDEEFVIKDVIEPKLGNIAPTVLELLEIEKPREMTEVSLLKEKSRQRLRLK